MSEKELTRRKICRYVMKQMWRLVRKGRMRLSSALKISWLLVRGKIRCHHSKVRGVSHDLRQKALCRIANSKRNQYTLFALREYQNAYDDHAVGIYVHFDTGEVDQVGYLSKELAGRYAEWLDSGHKLNILDADVVGRGKKYYGLVFEYILV